jgi:hypothetical protein
MRDRWNVFNLFDYVGVLVYDTETEMFSFEYKGTTPRAYEAYTCLNADKEPRYFKATLFDRVIPENAVDIREVLKQVGLKRYDAWELLKYTTLSCVTDFIWMQKGLNPENFYVNCIMSRIYAECNGTMDVFNRKCAEYKVEKECL